VEVAYQETSIRRESGRVLSQAPGAGAELEDGYPVAIIVGRYTPGAPEDPGPPPPSPSPSPEEGKNKDRDR